MSDELQQKFGQIYDQYIEKIYRFVYVKVDSKESAEDITSKVFMRGWESFKSAEIKNPGAFLYRIARNAVVDHYRERGRAVVIPADLSPEMPDLKQNIENMAVLSADVENIKKVIQKLDKEHQDIILLHYLEDMPLAEIAELMGRPAGTIRVMLHRGLKELRELL